MQKAHIVLNGRDVDSGAIKTPITRTSFLLNFIWARKLFPKPQFKRRDRRNSRNQIGQSSAFKPQLAIDSCQQSIGNSRETFSKSIADGKTAKRKSRRASLFGVLAEVVDSPEKYKLYVAKGGETFVDEQGVTKYLKSGEIYVRTMAAYRS